MAYLTFVNHPKRQFCTHQLVDRRMCEIASAYKKWCAETKRFEKTMDMESFEFMCEHVQSEFLHDVQSVASDMHTYGLIKTANDPHFDLWSFGCALYDKYLKA
jgi:hypothetical protein